MKPRFRPAMTWLHDWSGLVIGWLLLVIALAGTLSVFRQEIGDWARPAATCCVADTAQTGAAAVEWLARHAAHAPAWYITPGNARATTSYAAWADPAAPGGFFQKWLDARSGSPDGMRATLGGDFFYRLHFELQLPYPWGRILSGAAAMAMLLAILTGIVAHRRFFADFFTFRAGKGQRSWLDAHNLLGVTALPFHLMISFTGALTLANLLMPWGGLAAYRGDVAALQRDLYPAAVTRSASGRPAPLAPILPMLREAQARFEGGIGQINVFNPGDAASVVTVTSAEDARVGYQRAMLSFDGASGRLIAAHAERRPAIGVFDFLYSLHIGRFAGAAVRWLYFVSGLMLSAMIAAGLILWTSKRRQRPRHFGFMLVERLNVGFVAGTPIAFAAFFLANRLLPLDLANRADAEVRAVFWVWGAVLAAAALRAPARGWRDFTALGTIACLAIALIDALAGYAARSAVNLTIDALALGFAAAGAWAFAAMHGRTRRPAAARVGVA